MLLDFTHSWNDAWVAKDEQKWSVRVFEYSSLSFFLPSQVRLLWSLSSDGSLDLFRYIALLVISIGCYIAAYTLSGILFIWFNPSGEDCGLNVFFLVMTMILGFVNGIVALHPAVRKACS